MNNIQELAKALNSLNTDQKIYQFLTEIMTPSELIILSKRWRILKMLNEGYTQRDIAKELNVSLCKVTRGAKILKDQNAITTRYLKGDKIYE